jgi:hypothetical protein
VTPAPEHSSSSAPDVRPLARACARRATSAEDVRANEPRTSTGPSLHHRAMAHRSWALTPDRARRFARARAAFLARFEHEVDPDRTLPPDERARRAASALRAHMLDLARRSARSRRTG